MGIRGGVENLPWSFTATFAVMLVAIPAYSALVARVPRARAVPLVYRFFLLNLLGFWALVRLGVAPGMVARAFFVWVSVYNLFVVSVFWSVMADLFTAEQGKRIFGFVAAGGSAGAIAGPLVAALLAAPLGIPALILVSAALLEGATQAMLRLVAASRRAGIEAGAAVEAPGGAVGGSAWSGVGLVFRDPYLRGIGAQLLLYTAGTTILYFQTARLVAATIPEPARRTTLFAGVDLAVNVAALLTQSLATGTLVTRLGLGVALALVPALSAAGFLVAAAWSILPVLAVFQALRRAAEYAVQRPAREVLFTVVTREEKYKSKGFIDTVVYRAGDAGSAWLARGLAAAGAGVAGSMLAAVPVGLAGVGVALWLARRQRALEDRARGAAEPRAGGGVGAP
jgi:ATP:ADP antiporter, AAA family